MSTSERPETRFTKVGDIDIAYQVIGRADGLDLVFVPVFLKGSPAAGAFSQLKALRERHAF